MKNVGSWSLVVHFNLQEASLEVWVQQLDPAIRARVQKGSDREKCGWIPAQTFSSVPSQPIPQVLLGL